MAFAVVGVGHCTVDYLGVISRWPEADSKIELEEFSIQGGGPVATAMVALAGWGVATTVIGKISDDDFGVFIRRSLQEAGVDTSALVIEPGRVSPMSFIAVERQSARRTVFWTRGDVGLLQPGEIKMTVLEGAKILHVDGLQMEAQIAAAEQARKLGLHVVYDAGSPRAGMEKLLALTNTLVASERFAAEVAGGALAESLKRLQALGPATVVITLGPEGSVGTLGGDTFIVPALDVLAVDTTGAGDVYHGAYIYGLLQGWNLRECMHFATAAAGLKCRFLGGRAGIPPLEDIFKAMKNL